MTAMATKLAHADAANEPLLRLDDVHTYYGQIHALQGISIDVMRGEIVTLIGANGAGKTTTLKTISGLLHPRKGTVVFDGRNVSKTPAHELVESGIGHAPEGRRIFSRLTVLENLQMGGFTRKPAEISEDVEKVMTLFPRLRERTHQQGTTVLLVEQNALQALTVAHRGYVLQTGHVVLSGTGAELRENETVRKAYLGEV
jgi:branched-chain amino acid transport system ATP-binding protein